MEAFVLKEVTTVGPTVGRDAWMVDFKTESTPIALVIDRDQVLELTRVMFDSLYQWGELLDLPSMQTIRPSETVVLRGTRMNALSGVKGWVTLAIQTGPLVLSTNASPKAARALAHALLAAADREENPPNAST